MSGSVQDDLWRRERRAARYALSTFQSVDGFLEPPQIHVEADGLRMARLLAAQQVPGTAQLEVAQRDSITGAQVRVMLQDA